ncbi:MAG: patatin-like phospholipase family protein [Rubrivivax sp.]|nr:patatin-like phospholipase family protein [Rubrivivax sp.]
MKAKRRPVQRVDLALQGGGSHGAFTWGVLDRMLDEPWLGFDGVSGTSAGALNAAVLATGLARGGRAGAQAALRAFWEDVARGGACFGHAGGSALAAPTPWLPAWPAAPAMPFVQWFAEFTRLFSPYQFNPLDINPLRDIVRRHVELAAVRRGALAVFVNATAVTTGRPRIFHRTDLTHDALLASACLPQLFQAVEIDGVPYWDGGYSGNPALWPLIYETPSLDVVLVKIDPLTRPGAPATPLDIHDRVNEITFNAGLVGEMRAIAFVQKLHREGRLDSGQYKNLRLHMVADDEAMAALPPSSKLDTALPFLHRLHALGRQAAERWLASDAAHLGRRSTLDVRRVFLGESEQDPAPAPKEAPASAPRRGRRRRAQP